MKPPTVEANVQAAAIESAAAVVSTPAAPEVAPVPPDELPPISLDAHLLQSPQPHWVTAALRTSCPIEQHMRHGRSLEQGAQAQYLAHTGAHQKPAAEWAALTAKIRGGR